MCDGISSLNKCMKQCGNAGLCVSVSCPWVRGPETVLEVGTSSPSPSYFSLLSNFSKIVYAFGMIETGTCFWGTSKTLLGRKRLKNQ